MNWIVEKASIKVSILMSHPFILIKCVVFPAPHWLLLIRNNHATHFFNSRTFDFAHRLFFTFPKPVSV